MNELKRKEAVFEDLTKIVLRRSKIEQWIDEPFFTETMLNSFVRVGFSQKYIIAQIRDIKDDEKNSYILANGKKTGVYFKLLLTEDSHDKLKWFKINQISNQEISRQEFEKLRMYRKHF